MGKLEVIMIIVKFLKKLLKYSFTKAQIKKITSIYQYYAKD